VVIEQDDESLVAKRYLSNHSLETALDQEKNEQTWKDETRELAACPSHRHADVHTRPGT
jgi:hypothetical protein